MNSKIPVLFVAVCFSWAAQAQFSISPLTTFGGGDGWLAPGEGGYPYLGTSNLERGLAYNPLTGHLYLVSRANVEDNSLNIRILDKLTGADLGGLPVGTGIITGGTFPINMVAVGGDGAIYVANLTIQATTTPYKIYKWDTESSTPVVVYNGTPIAGGRVGDSFDAIGSGSSTLLVAGFGSSPSVPGNNGYAIIDPTAGTHTQVTFSGTPPNAGDFRLGVTFTDSSRVIGAQGGSGGTTFARYTSYSGSTGTLLNTISLTNSTAQAIMDYAEVGGRKLLATHSFGDSTVRIWDIADPTAPVLLGSANNTSGPLTSNSNGTGQMAWGDIEFDTGLQLYKAKLWTMSSNQGIQAFVVVIPEPSTMGLTALGALLAAWALRRRHP